MNLEDIIILLTFGGFLWMVVLMTLWFGFMVWTMLDVRREGR